METAKDSKEEGILVLGEERVMDTLEEMTRIQEIKEPSNQDKNHYLRLTSLLSSFLEQSSDERIQKKVGILKDARDKLPALYGYDVRHDAFWQESQPHLSQISDELLIQFLGDDFRGFGDKQHIMNAIKYLGSENLPKQKRWAIYDIILPSIEDPQKSTRTFLRELFQNMPEEIRFKHEQPKVRSKKELETLIHSAEHAGMGELSVIMPSFLDYNKEGSPLISQLSKEEPTDTSTFRNRGLKDDVESLLKGLTYTVLGNFSGKMQTRFAQRWEWYDLEQAGHISAVATFLGGAGLMGGAIAIYGQSSEDPFSLQKIQAGIMGMGGVLLYMAQFYRNLRTNKAPSIEVVSSNKNKEEEQKDEPFSYDNVVLVNLTIAPENVSYTPKGIPSTTRKEHSKLEELARKEVSDEAEKNVVWDPLYNHHTQGEQFLKELKPEFGYSTQVLRDSDAIAVEWSFTFDDYTKGSMLVCLQHERYLLTYVAPKDATLNVEQISSLLLRGDSVEKKGEALVESCKAAHLHLTHYSRQEKLGEFQGSYEREQMGGLL